MRKAALLIIVILSLSIILYGCEKPEDVSEVYYKIGLKALEITDMYLDIEITSAEMSDSLEGLYYRFGDDLTTDELLLSSSILNLKIAASSDQRNGGEYDEILELRNDLAAELNKGKR